MDKKLQNVINMSFTTICQKLYEPFFIGLTQSMTHFQMLDSKGIL